MSSIALELRIIGSPGSRADTPYLIVTTFEAKEHPVYWRKVLAFPGLWEVGVGLWVVNE
jgi:hypothetical protein